jgi:hypothetical protein
MQKFRKIRLLARAMRLVFRDFCINWILIDPLHYLSSRSDFGFDSPHRWVGESAIECLKEKSPHWWVWESCRVGEWGRLPSLASRGVADSPHRRVGEAAIEYLKGNPLIGELEIRWLPDSSSQRVSDSPHQRVAVSLWWVRESLFKFFKIYHQFTEL